MFKVLQKESKKFVYKIIKRWEKSVALKISIFLLIVSAILLILAFSSWGNFSEDTANNINSFLIGLATGFIGIIVTISFVEHFIDKQNEEYEKKEELELIMRYDRIMEPLISRYIAYFNCITTPKEKRGQIVNGVELQVDFDFRDLCDMYERTNYRYLANHEPSIILFCNAEEMLRNYMIKMIENISFKYYVSIRECLMEFIKKSFSCDIRRSIVENSEIAENSDIIQSIRKNILDCKVNWIKKVQEAKYHGIMCVYVSLYDLLNTEAELINKYNEELRKLK